MTKIYKCCKCGKILEEYKPIRLVKQQYNLKPYKQYVPVEHYDFCKRCFAVIDKWIKKGIKDE